MKIVINQAHIDFLTEKRIYVERRGRNDEGWLKLGKPFVLERYVEVEPYAEFQVGPRLFTMGSFSFSRTSLPMGVKVGRYCTIANNVALMSYGHPTDGVTFANIDYKTGHACYNMAVADSGKGPLPQRKWDNLPVPKLEIGDSVWIGEKALLGRNIKIGTGALIASRAVVTKDVPPYTMVAGNPAVPKGKFDGLRHPPELVERLLESEWWRYNFTDFHEFYHHDPEKFLDGFEQYRDRLKMWSPKKVNISREFSRISDEQS